MCRQRQCLRILQKADELDKSYTLKQHEKFLWMKRTDGGTKCSDPVFLTVTTVPESLIFQISKHDIARREFPFTECIHQTTWIRMQ